MTFIRKGGAILVAFSVAGGLCSLPAGATTCGCPVFDDDSLNAKLPQAEVVFEGTSGSPVVDDDYTGQPSVVRVLRTWKGSLPETGRKPVGSQVPIPRILVIDDDPALLEVLTLAFETAGHAVTCARDGTQGMSLMAKQPPHLVVSDVNMPGLYGFALRRKLRGVGNRVPVILFTTKIKIDAQVSGC